MTRQHDYASRIVWTGNRGTGTSAYRAYDRTWDFCAPGKPVVHCSNDPLLGGNPALPNPEDMLITALSSCHMLWYLHLASVAGIVVTAYEDNPLGVGEVAADGAGQFVSATLRPTITLAEGTDLAKAEAIHGEIHRYCFIARSINFPVQYDANYITA